MVLGAVKSGTTNKEGITMSATAIYRISERFVCSLCGARIQEQAFYARTYGAGGQKTPYETFRCPAYRCENNSPTAEGWYRAR